MAEQRKIIRRCPVIEKSGVISDGLEVLYHRGWVFAKDIFGGAQIPDKEELMDKKASAHPPEAGWAEAESRLFLL